MGKREKCGCAAVFFRVSYLPLIPTNGNFNKQHINLHFIKVISFINFSFINR